MAEQCQMLSELTNGSNWARIQVRVSRIWDSISRAKEVYSLNLQLLDIKGNQKHAIIPKGLLDKYVHTFDEQCLYEIENFNVLPAETNYRVIDDDLMILIRRDTKVKRLHDVLTGIPTHKFGFVTDDVLAVRIDKVHQLTDIAGLLTGISEVIPITTRTGCQTAKRELILKTESGKSIVVTLWADKTNLVDMSTANSTKHLPLVVLTSLIVKLYRGEFTFSSTNATKYDADVDIPELTKLISSSEVQNLAITTIEHQPKLELLDESKPIRATIADILADIRKEISSGKRYIILVTIMKINTTSGWKYLSCPKCRKTVQKEDNFFTCPKCKNTVHQPLNRYRLTVEVFDHTSTTTVILFDNDATNLLMRSVDDMIQLQNLENGEAMVEKLFNHMIGAEVQMEFRPTDYDNTNRGRTLTVNKIEKVHHPYSQMHKDSTEDKSKIEVDENTSSQLTTEMAVVESNSTKLKGKMKVEQGADEPKENTAAYAFSTTVNNTAKGVVIKDADEIRKQKQKKQGGANSKRKKKN